MVKVIGERKKEETVCTSCTCILQYTNNDVTTIHGRDYGGGPAGNEFIFCPNCSKRVILKSW